MRLPDSLRDRLKAPLGTLIPEESTSKAEIRRHVPDGSYVIAVGDRTTKKMMGFGMVPHLQIIDGMEQRNRSGGSPMPPMPPGSTTLSVDNPAAQITEESIGVVREALRTPPPVRLQVCGEEDLLVIPACIHAPDGATVMYGQPNEGLVIVGVTPEIRNKAQILLDSME